MSSFLLICFCAADIFAQLPSEQPRAPFGGPACRPRCSVFILLHFCLLRSISISNAGLNALVATMVRGCVAFPFDFEIHVQKL